MGRVKKGPWRMLCGRSTCLRKKNGATLEVKEWQINRVLADRPLRPDAKENRRLCL